MRKIYRVISELSNVLFVRREAHTPLQAVWDLSNVSYFSPQKQTTFWHLIVSCMNGGSIKNFILKNIFPVF